MKNVRSYDRTCYEIPKWCPSIGAVRSRPYVAGALRELRTHRKTTKNAA